MANDNDLDLDQGTIEELIKIATDPSYDDGDFGVLGQGIQGLPKGGPVLQPSFQQGGMVQGQQQPPPRGGVPLGPGIPGATVGAQVGVAARQAGAQPGQGPQITPQQMEAEVQRLISERPQELLRVKQAFEQGLANGEITMEELNLAGQLATAAAQNPQLWPQLRRFAIQKGLAEENEIQQEYDQGLVFGVLLAVKAVQGGGPQAQGQPPQAVGGASQAQGQPPQVVLRTGGAVPNSRNKDGSVAITAHDGEFVIPKHVVREKGTDFFNKLIEPKDAKTA
jgi:hypothetical protein